MEPRILFENTDVCVIDKPIGWLVHEDGHTEAPTVVDWFLSSNPEVRGVGEPQTFPDGTPIERSGVVHRLDRETSGVLILAKTQTAYNHLKLQFHDRHAEKEYHAITHGYFKAIKGRIENPIGRSRKDARLRSALPGARGTLRAATTDWQLITQNASFAHLRVLPKTGRTHQIRVHLKAIGHPIVGDELYVGKKLQATKPDFATRLMLHAHRLTITLPDGELQSFVAPVPEVFDCFFDTQSV